jgi:hypothetical protein
MRPARRCWTRAATDTKSGYFWAIVSDDRGHGGAGPPIVLFHYAPGRGKAHPLSLLDGYRGRFLQCDAYQSYDALTEIVRDNGPWQLVYCWTHVRRRFVKRLETDGSPIAEEALRQIALLYAIEKTVRGRAPEIRLAARRELRPRSSLPSDPGSRPSSRASRRSSSWPRTSGTRWASGPGSSASSKTGGSSSTPTRSRTRSARSP